MSILEVIAVISSALGIWLITRRSLVAWPITLLACFLYAEVFREARLYSDMLLQFVYAAFCIYGWWHWLNGVREQGDVRVESFNWQGWLFGGLAGLLGSLSLGLGAVDHLQEVADARAHARVHVGLAALDVVVEVVAEHLDLVDGLFPDLGRLEMPLEKHCQQNSGHRQRPRGPRARPARIVGTHQTSRSGRCRC